MQLPKKLSKNQYPLNGKPVFIRKRLSYHDVETKKAADNMNPITKTETCQIIAFVSQRDRNVFTQLKGLK